MLSKGKGHLSVSVEQLLGFTDSKCVQKIPNVGRDCGWTMKKETIEVKGGLI